MNAWYLLRCKPRQEKRAIENLENQNFVVYCPWLHRKNAKVEPLFPGYLFLMFDDNDCELQFSKVRSTRGVMAFVKFGSQFAIMPEVLVEGIRKQEQLLKKDPLFKIGQIVEFCDGPFKEMQAVYLCEDGEHRSMVMLKILNQEQSIRVKTDYIRKA